MKKIAIIERITHDDIFATYLKSDNGGHSRAFIKVQEDLSFKVDNQRNIFLKKGDSVEIFIEPKGAIAITFAMFIMPLIIFFLTYSLANALLGGNSEIFKILAGLIGIVISFVTTYVYFKIRPQKLPKILRKLTSAEAEASCSLSKGCSSCPGCGS